MRRYTDHERACLREIIPGHSYADIMRTFTERLGADITRKQLLAFIKNNHVNTGLTGRFEKGHVPANKGRKGWSAPGTEATRFHTGIVPHNVVPIGTEKLREDGYVYVKVQNGHKNANWKQKHLVLWEAEHGLIPRGSVVIFANSDSTDVRIENLLLAERADLAVINKRGLMGCDSESTRAGILTARLIRKACSRSKERRS